MNPTSSSLLERLRQPCDDEASAKFVGLYTPLLYYWARGMGLSSRDSADLVQDVLTTLVRKMPEFTYDSGRSFRGWLRTVTLNTWRKTVRQAVPNVVSQDGIMSGIADADDGRAFEEDEYRRHLVGQALELMQSKFQPTTWRACWASVVEGKSAEEIALDLGITRNAVYLAKSRVLRVLYQELQGLLD
jgi:RNA polymerase sigma-70 factor (ECF subfamily)